MKIVSIILLVGLTAPLLHKSAAVTTSCYYCASPGLQLNWALTEFPIMPNDIAFADSCMDFPQSTDADNIDPTEVTNGTFKQINGTSLAVTNGLDSVCDTEKACIAVKKTVAGKMYIVRGCVEKFFIDYTLQATDDQLKNHICNYTVFTDADGHQSENAVDLCFDSNPCNNFMNSSVTSAVNNGFVTCSQTKSIECIACSWLDHHGKCKHNSKGRCKGAYCSKTKGSLGDLDFETRGCAMNPMGLDKMDQKYSRPFSTPGQSISQIYSANTRFCNNADNCNSSPVFFSAVPLIVLAIYYLIPF